MLHTTSHPRALHCSCFAPSNQQSPTAVHCSFNIPAFQVNSVTASTCFSAPGSVREMPLKKFEADSLCGLEDETVFLIFCGPTPPWGHSAIELMIEAASGRATGQVPAGFSLRVPPPFRHTVVFLAGKFTVEEAQAFIGTIFGPPLPKDEPLELAGFFRHPKHIFVEALQWSDPPYVGEAGGFYICASQDLSHLLTFNEVSMVDAYTFHLLWHHVCRCEGGRWSSSRLPCTMTNRTNKGGKLTKEVASP